MSVLSGAISWFGGASDPTAGPTTASGAGVGTPGIAVYDRSTLGGYWLIHMPNGKAAVVRQTDIGPAPSTGRKFDFTYSLIPLLGYSQQTFPTNSNASGVYLGKTPADLAANLSSAVSQLGLSPIGLGAISSAQAGQILQQVNSSGVAPVSVKGAPTNPGQAAADAANAVGNAVSSVPNAIAGVFNQAVTDAKYAAVLIGALVIAVVLMTHGITGQTPAGLARKAPL